MDWPIVRQIRHACGGCADYRMSFGKYQNHSLEELATSNAGLRYLDWALEFYKFETTGMRAHAHAVIKTFLAPEAMKRKLAAAFP